MTLSNIIKVYHAFLAENDPSNAEIIAFYERMIPIWIDKAYAKALKKLF